MRFLSAIFPSPSRSFWVATQPPVYQPLLPVLYCLQTCWRVHSVHSGRSLMKTLNNTGFRISPQATPPVTAPQLYFTLLITTPWAWQFSQVSVHLSVHLPSPYLTSLSMRMLRKTVSKLKENRICWSSLNHWACHLTAEGCEVSKAWFPFHTSILTTPSHLLAHNMPGNGFHAYLLCHFPGMRWGWWACTSPVSPSCCPWKEEWQSHSSSPRESPPVTTTFQRLWRVA